MSEKKNGKNEAEIVPVEPMALEEMQITEQLYHNAGLDPVIDAGLKDFDDRLKGENKFINKVLGPRESDIRGYGEAVARRVAYAVYGLMNRQYGGKMGDLREYMMALQDERDRANTRYDDLMGRVVGILGEEYRQLRSDSNEFMGKLTDILGEDIKASKIDQEALAAKLADIDGLRNQVVNLAKEKQAQQEKYEARLEEQKKTGEAALEKQGAEYDSRLGEQKAGYETKLLEQQKQYEDKLIQQKDSYEGKLEKQQEKHDAAVEKLTEKHEREVGALETRITGLEEKVKGLETVKAKQEQEIAGLKADYARLEAAANGIDRLVSLDEMSDNLGEELHTFILEDSKVPDMVIDGVGKFIDFRKYFGLAARKGAETLLGEAQTSLKDSMKKPEK